MTPDEDIELVLLRWRDHYYDDNTMNNDFNAIRAIKALIKKEEKVNE